MQKSLVLLALFAAFALAGHLKIPTTYTCDSKFIAVISGTTVSQSAHRVSNGDEIYEKSTFDYSGQKSEMKMWLFKSSMTRYNMDSYSVGTCRSEHLTPTQFENNDIFGSINAKAKGPGQRCLSVALHSGHIWTFVENTTTIETCVSKDETTPYYIRLKDSARPNDPVAVMQLNFTKTAPAASELALPSACSAPVTSTAAPEPTQIKTWTSAILTTYSESFPITKTVAPLTSYSISSESHIITASTKALPSVNIPETYFTTYVSQSPSWTENGNVTRQKNGNSVVQTVNGYYSTYFVNATGGLYNYHEKYDHNCTVFNMTVEYNYDDDLAGAFAFKFPWSITGSCGPFNSGWEWKQEYSSKKLCTDETATQPIWLHTSYKNITYTEFRIENLPAFNLPKECTK